MIRRLLLAILLVLLAAPVLAQVRISGDTFVVDETASRATFSGSVVIERQGLTVWADRVMVEYGAGGMENIHSFLATGHVRIKTADQDATGEQATFDPRTQRLRLTGNVTVVNAAGTLTGPELVVDLRDNTSVFSSRGGGRVTGVFSTE